MDKWNMKKYIYQTSLNNLERIGIECIHIKWINEIMKKYIIELVIK
jgi:hypothetical protein